MKSFEMVSRSIMFAPHTLESSIKSPSKKLDNIFAIPAERRNYHLGDATFDAYLMARSKKRGQHRK